MKYWLYAPGENASKWNEFHSEGIMAIGWGDLGNLLNLNSKAEIQNQLKEIYDNTSSQVNNALCCFEFCHSITNGDLIISKKGTRNYLGYGIVESDYYYDESVKSYKHRRKVNWIKNGVWQEISDPIVVKTLTDITKYPEYVEKLCSLIGINRKGKGPEFLRFMLPIIKILKENNNFGKPKEITNKVIEYCRISDGELEKKLSTGFSRVKNQIHWARFYLVKAGYIDSSKRGIWKLTDKGISEESKEENVYSLFKFVREKFTEKPEEIETIHEIEQETKSIEVSYDDLFQQIDFKRLLKYDPLSLSDPQRIKIQQVINKCSETKWVVPHFQRYFDWNKKNIKELIESVFYDYYIGSFLLWETKRSPELGITPINGVEKNSEDLNPTEIILDGQQRITALYYAIKAPNNVKINGVSNKVYFYINFRNFMLNEEKTDVVEIHPQNLSKEETFKRILFPLYELENYSDWVYGFEEFLETNKFPNDDIRKIRRVIESKLRHFWSGFEIPYISLPEQFKLTQVTDIFENINTKGKLLNVFDLLIARLYKYDIELKRIWDNTGSEYKIINRYFEEGRIEKIPIYILQSISLCYSKTSTCKRSDILNIYSQIYGENSERVFIEDWEELSYYLGLALEKLENMRDGFGVRSEKDLPFAPMIPVLAALLKVIDDKENKANCYKKIKKWYWSAIFTTAYSSAADTQMTNDFREVKTWFENDDKIPKVVSTLERELYNTNFHDIQSTSNAKYKGVLSLIALAGAKDFNTELTLENSKENDKYHIFPKAMPNVPNKFINSILNITWMSDGTNREIKGCMKPSAYIKDFIVRKYNNEELRFKQILETHFIDDVAFGFLKNNEFEKFINQREQLLKNKIIDILEINDHQDKTQSLLISGSTPFSNRRSFVSTLGQCNKYIYWLDKFFSIKGLDYISQIIDGNRINDIRIIISVEKAEENFLKNFKDFKKELKNKDIEVNLKVILQPKIKSSIHDRFIITQNQAYNIPSPDIVARNQLSEITKSQNHSELKKIFGQIWNNSVDIIDDWNKIVQKQEEIYKFRDITG